MQVHDRQFGDFICRDGFTKQHVHKYGTMKKAPQQGPYNVKGKTGR